MIVVDAMILTYALVDVPERTGEVDRAAERLVDGRTLDVHTDEVLPLASAPGLSAYDAEYVVLARRFGVQLLTTDGPVLQAFVAVHPRDFAP